MKRTQLYLEEETARLLAAESRRRRTTVSELVREAITATYGSRKASDRSAVISRVAGVWADRADLGCTDDFVRGIRRSARPMRWERDQRAAVPSRQRRHH